MLYLEMLSPGLPTLFQDQCPSSWIEGDLIIPPQVISHRLTRFVHGTGGLLCESRRAHVAWKAYKHGCLHGGAEKQEGFLKEACMKRTLAKAVEKDCEMVIPKVKLLFYQGSDGNGARTGQEAYTQMWAEG